MFRRPVRSWITALSVLLMLACSGDDPAAPSGVVDPGPTTDDPNEIDVPIVPIVDVTEPTQTDGKSESVEPDPGQGDGQEEPACQPAPEGEPQPFLCPCEQDDDCFSGHCLTTADGKTCTQACIDDCPAGWSCAILVGTCPDCAQVCIPKYVTLCRPCDTNAECQNPYFSDETGARCVVAGNHGRFCGAGCESDADCPGGFVCESSELVDKTSATQCVPKGAFCECSQLAVDQGAQTTCFVQNPLGKCQGSRVCTDAGLSACDAPIPVPEECDGLDNDCDGLLDEGSCADSETCACNEQGCACGCAPGFVDCGTGCVDVTTSVAHCGDCNAPCDGEHVATFVCSDGQCGIAKCETAFEDKDSIADNGCECPVTDEVCDGEDNDCDGQIDEGELCAGIGDCAGLCEVGTCTCPAGCDGCKGTCVPLEQYENDPANCGLCGKVCDLPGTALETCEGGICQAAICDDGWKDCNEVPSDGCEWEVASEICDLIDNDCDGAVDEQPLADCEAPKICDGGWCQCPPDQPELFDCPESGCKNLQVDATNCGFCGNDCAAAEWPGVANYKCSDGVCAVGACTPPFQDTNKDPYDGCECQKTSTIETCDGIDNNCDGEIDEEPLAACKPPKSCQWGTCICDPAQPNLQACEGDSCIDVTLTVTHCGFCGNDCNGLGLPNVAKYTCSGSQCGIGQCTPPWVDVDEDPFTGCECQKTATIETCDSIDNDCDGAIDELPNNCLGGKVCVFGSCTCPLEEPNMQDCGTGLCVNTKTDQSNCGFCGNPCELPGVAYQKCEDGQCIVPACKPPLKDCNGQAFDGCEWTVAPESCNGIDDDCDGDVDETPTGMGQFCETGLPGLCASGKTVCQLGSTQCSPNVSPGSTAEVCNGKDEDCDGVADNGNPGGGGPCFVAGQLGECAKGVLQCEGGKPICKQVVFNQSEQCDGLDNNCDGKVDGQQQSCSSDCGAGLETCFGGNWNGCTAQKPKSCLSYSSCNVEQMCVTVCPSAPPETCDGLDNNCNGQKDETFACSPGDSKTQSCGPCGTQQLTCSGSCSWQTGPCISNGQCTPGDSQSQPCGSCGQQTRSCSGSCNWGSWGSCGGQGQCSPGATQKQPCGTCGQQSRTCTNSCSWGGWGSCGGGGECTPGTSQTQPCGSCGQQTRTCNGSCSWGSWGSCGGQGACSPGATKYEGSCGQCGKNKYQCSSSCSWQKQSGCYSEGVCSPGAKVACDGCKAKVCQSNCTWSSCGGATMCGGKGEGGCYCDPTCVSAGDCCPGSGSTSACGACGYGCNSCESKTECGGSGGNCFCDDKCIGFKDCCNNARSKCGVQTCQNACGQDFSSGCDCDWNCGWITQGPCCADENTLCD